MAVNGNSSPAPRRRRSRVETAAQQSAFGMIRQFLDERGLGALAEWAWTRYKDLGGTTNGNAFDVIQVEMVERKEFKERFPAYEHFRKLGQAVPIDYIRDYERRARESLGLIGADQAYSNQDIQKIMMGGVSAPELNSRVESAAAAADSPALATSELQRMYGLPRDLLARFWLDPDRTMVDIQKQWEAGQIGAFSIDAGMGQLTTGEAERIAAGTTTDQAAARFADMGQAQGIFGNQVGDSTSLGRNDMIGFAAGETAAATAVNRRSQTRKAAYAGGSGFSASQRGVVGLGNGQ